MLSHILIIRQLIHRLLGHMVFGHHDYQISRHKQFLELLISARPGLLPEQYVVLQGQERQ